jgi:hypothetical protein
MQRLDSRLGVAHLSLQAKLLTWCVISRCQSSCYPQCQRSSSSSTGTCCACSKLRCQHLQVRYGPQKPVQLGSSYLAALPLLQAPRQQQACHPLRRSALLCLVQRLAQTQVLQLLHVRTSVMQV